MVTSSPGSSPLPSELRDLPTPTEAHHAAQQQSPVAKLTLGERSFFVGHTGSGKTYLASQFISDVVPPRLPVVVVDPKGMFEPPTSRGKGWDILGDLPRSWERRIRREKRPSLLRVVIRPEYHVDQTKNEVLNWMYTRLFNAGKCLVYLDEIQALVYNTRSHPSLSRLVQMGRQKQISVWGSTLRPAAIPRMFISESDHIFCFRLRDADDRDRMSQIIGPWGKVTPGPGKHDFWYMPPGVESMDPILVHQPDEDVAA